MQGLPLTQNPRVVYPSRKRTWKATMEHWLVPTPDRQYLTANCASSNKRLRVPHARRTPVGTAFAAEFEPALLDLIKTLKVRDITQQEAFKLAKVSCLTKFWHLF